MHFSMLLNIWFIYYSIFVNYWSKISKIISICYLLVIKFIASFFLKKKFIASLIFSLNLLNFNFIYCVLYILSQKSLNSRASIYVLALCLISFTKTILPIKSIHLWVMTSYFITLISLLITSVMWYEPQAKF